MLKQWADKISGYKTHIIQVVSVVIALVAFVYGPVDIAGVHIPHIEFKDLLEILQVGGGLSFLRMALNKKDQAATPPQGEPKP